MLRLDPPSLRFFRLLVVIFTLSAAAGTSGCAYLNQIVKQPEVSFDRANFRAVDFEKLNVDLHLKITNPNVFGAAIDGYAVKFVVDDMTLLDGDVNQELDLGAGSTGTLVVPVTFRWEEIASKVGDIMSGKPVPDHAPFRAVGNVRVRTVLGELTIPYDFKGKFPVIAPPVIKPVAVRLQQAGIAGVTFAVDVDVQNVSGRPFGLKSFDHALRFSGRPVVSGRVADNLPVAARSTETRTVEFTLSALEAGASLLALVQSGGRVDVKYTGTAQVDTGIGVVPMSFDSSQGLRIRK
jgi:LEA14-like dessication related protein